MKKKALKITLIVLGTILIAVLAFLTYYLIITSGVNLDKNKLVNMNSSVEIYDNDGNLLEELSDGKSVTDAGDIPDYTLNAFVAIEDKRFYSHHGTDFKGFLRATFNNIKSFSFKEGASTISQQLIKNTHLSGEKTLKRKLLEFKLAGQLEKNFSKKEILEMYVNTIYFGDGCYGITKAANRYFGVSPAELSISQSAALAGMIKSPAVYSPRISPENCNARKNVVLKEMYKQNYISEADYNESLKTNIVPINYENDIHSPYLKLVREELNDFLDKTAYSKTKFKVYTYYDKKLQSALDEIVNDFETNTDKKALLLDNNNNIKAFYSTCGDIKRQLGSTIKPLAVFAPAIDMNIIDSCTPINDEKINFDGYSPSNYNNKYYGYVSAKFALSKSLNSCAVKVLNDCGTEKCLNYLNKMDIETTKNDASLALALGSTEKGASLVELSGAYGTFINKGNYSAPKTIKNICTEDGKTVYSETKSIKKVYSEETAFLINDMLKNTVKEGTAKTLSALNIPLSAKTGTVGTENGNSDAYSVSYNGDYVLSCWLGNSNGSLMSNEISGGSLPTKICFNVWQNMINNGYKANDTFTTDKVSEIAIDKISYNENHKIEIADENSPDRFILTEYFKKDRIPQKVSERFSKPKIESGKLSVNNNQITIQLCLPNYCEFKLYRLCEDIKTIIYDSYGKTNKTEFTDKFILPDKTYEYYATPYVIGKNGIKEGKEYELGKIKTPPYDFEGDDWWLDLSWLLEF